MGRRLVTGNCSKVGDHSLGRSVITRRGQPDIAANHTLLLPGHYDQAGLWDVGGGALRCTCIGRSLSVAIKKIRVHLLRGPLGSLFH